MLVKEIVAGSYLRLVHLGDELEMEHAFVEASLHILGVHPAIIQVPV